MKIVGEYHTFFILVSLLVSVKYNIAEDELNVIVDRYEEGDKIGKKNNEKLNCSYIKNAVEVDKIYCKCPSEKPNFNVFTNKTFSCYSYKDLCKVSGCNDYEGRFADYNNTSNAFTVNNNNPTEFLKDIGLTKISQEVFTSCVLDSFKANISTWDVTDWKVKLSSVSVKIIGNRTQYEIRIDDKPNVNFSAHFIYFQMWCEVELPKVYHFMVKTSGKSKLKNHIHSDDNIINTPSSKKASPATATTTKPTTATLTILATTRTILADDSGARTNVLMQFIVVPIAIVAFFVILGIVWYLKVRNGKKANDEIEAYEDPVQENQQIESEVIDEIGNQKNKRIIEIEEEDSEKKITASNMKQNDYEVPPQDGCEKDYYNLTNSCIYRNIALQKYELGNQNNTRPIEIEEEDSEKKITASNMKQNDYEVPPQDGCEKDYYNLTNSCIYRNIALHKYIESNDNVYKITSSEKRNSKNYAELSEEYHFNSNDKTYQSLTS